MVPKITQVEHNFIGGDIPAMQARYVQGIAVLDPNENLLRQTLDPIPGTRHLFLVNIHAPGDPWYNRAVWIATDGDIWYPIDIRVLRGRAYFILVELQNHDLRHQLNIADKLSINELITQYVQKEFGDR